MIAKWEELMAVLRAILDAVRGDNHRLPIETYSLDEAARMLCGPGMKRPTIWLRRQISIGRIKAYKPGPQVRMTEQHILEAIRALEIGGTTPQPARSGPTAASLRRRQAS